MNRYFSDWLPPALVRDWRRSLRSGGYIAMLVLALLGAVWCQYRYLSADGEGGSSATLQMTLIALLMLVIIPNRAADAVSADARVKGTNFMMLTPLSSRQIVWGIWFSALLQLLLVAGVGGLLLWWRLSTEPSLWDKTLEVVSGVHVPQVIMLYLLMVGLGVVMIAMFMFLAQMSRLFRWLVGLGLLFHVAVWVIESFEASLYMPGLDPLPELLSGFCGTSLYLCLFDAALVVWSLLELARRSYAAPAENCSRGVRLLVLLFLLTVPALYYLAPDLAEDQLAFVRKCVFVLCMSDALLPVYSLAAHDRRAWPLIPAYLQVPGIGQAALFLVLVMSLCAVITSVYYPSGSEWWVEVMSCASFCGLILMALLLTDLCSKRTNVNRPIICMAAVMLLAALNSVIYFACSEPVLPYVAALLPGCIVTRDMGGLNDPSHPGEFFAVLSILSSLLVLILLMWRGRRR